MTVKIRKIPAIYYLFADKLSLPLYAKLMAACGDEKTSRVMAEWAVLIYLGTQKKSPNGLFKGPLDVLRKLSLGDVQHLAKLIIRNEEGVVE
jgi:hypothetical protein